MRVTTITTEADYDAALREIEIYFDAEPVPGSDEAARFGELSALIEGYEKMHWTVSDPRST